MNQWITFVFIGHQMNVLQVLRGASCRRVVAVLGAARATAPATTFVVVRSFVRSPYRVCFCRRLFVVSHLLSINCYTCRLQLQIRDRETSSEILNAVAHSMATIDSASRRTAFGRVATNDNSVHTLSTRSWQFIRGSMPSITTSKRAIIPQERPLAG